MTVAVPPRREAVERLLGGALEADRLERVVDAAAGEVADRLHRVVRRGVDDVGRAELRAVRQLVLHGVDGDDHARAGDARALDRGEADAAAAEHGDRRARLDLRACSARRRRRS